jgi:oligoendopeptidase F
MSLSPIPNLSFAIDTNRWEEFQARYDDLHQRPLEGTGLTEWLHEWSELNKLVEELGSIAYIETSLDTADEAKEQVFLNFVDNMAPNFLMADQALKKRLLSMVSNGADRLGAEMTVPVRKMRNQAELFREPNVPLQTELSKLANEYDKITGGLKVDWDGDKKNLSQLDSLLREPERAVRERAWRTIMELWQSQRTALNDLYSRMLALRQQIAVNAGLPDFRAYTFRAMDRFDYTPEDCLQFHEAIEKVVVPAAERVYERKRQQLGLESLRTWDVLVDPSPEPPLNPYKGQAELIDGSLRIFNQVDPELAREFALMAEENLLDLDTRAGKALGGYCSPLVYRGRPFIFMNGDGIHDDVQTMLHEAGHAFHDFAAFRLPYIWQMDIPLEFCEVASMGMELLAAPYLTADKGGFYTQAEAARARIEHLEGILTFLPYMAVVDAFQHWVYTHPESAADPANCDGAWDSLWARFMRGIDWTGFEVERATGWHRKLHIFRVPFYYIEYGMAQVGALQVWRNALRDQVKAVDTYKAALALGSTKPLPDLYAAAGAEFRFDAAMLGDLVALIEETLEQLRADI